MANPFMYDDPTLKTTAVLNDAMRNAASIMGLKNQADYQQEHNRLLGQHYANEAVNQAAQRVNEQAKLKPSQVNFSTAHIMPYLRNIQVQKIDKHWKPVTDLLMTHVANNNMNAGAVYDDIATNFDTSYKPLMRDALIAEAQAQPDGADLGVWNKKLQALEDMKGEDAARSILPSVHNERMNEKAALQANRPNRKQITEMTSPDGKTAQKFSVDVETGEMTPLGQPYLVKSQVTNVNVHGPAGPTPNWQYIGTDENGNAIQQNSRTGEMRTTETKVSAKPSSSKGKEKGFIKKEFEKRNAGGSYKYTATDGKGNRIFSNDGSTWIDKDGKPIK